MTTRRNLLKSTTLLGLAASTATSGLAYASDVRVRHSGVSIGGANQSLAYHWLDTLLNIAVRDVELHQARPTILARAMAIVTEAM